MKPNQKDANIRYSRVNEDPEHQNRIIAKANFEIDVNQPRQQQQNTQLIQRNDIWVYFLLIVADCILVLTFNMKCDIQRETEYCMSYLRYKLYIGGFNILFLSIFNILLVKNALQKTLPWVCAAASIVNFIYFSIFYDWSVTEVHFGAFISAILIAVQSVVLLFYFGYRASKFCSNLIGQKLSLLIVLLVLLLMWYRLQNACGLYKESITGAVIDNSGKYCQVSNKYLCWMEFFSGYTTFAYIDFNKKCDHLNGDEKFNLDLQFPNYLNDQYIGFPLTSKFDGISQLSSSFKSKVVAGTHPVESVQAAFEQGLEVVLDQTNLQYHIQIKKNKTLADERRAVFQQKNQVYKPKRLINIFVDNVSRREAKYVLNQTLEWMIKFEDDKKRGRNIQFLRYHSTRHSSSPNMVPLMNGDTFFAPLQQYTESLECDFSFDRELYQSFKGDQKQLYWHFTNFLINNEPKSNKHCEEIFNEVNNNFKYYFDPKQYKNGQKPKIFKKFPNLGDYAKNQGYITASSTNHCAGNIFVPIYEHLHERYYFENYDHQGYAWACDYNYEENGNTYSPTRGISSLFARCLYNRHVHQYTLEYAEKFLEAYQDQNVFINLELLDSHEITNEVAQYLDVNLAKFLERLEQQGLLEDTVLNVFSDHGQGMYFLSWTGMNQFNSEKNFPSLYLFLPNKLIEQRIPKDNREQFFEKKTQEIFTIVDFRNFLIEASGHQFEQGKSFFEDDDEFRSARSCLDVISIWPQEMEHKVTNFDEFMDHCSCQFD